MTKAELVKENTLLKLENNKLRITLRNMSLDTPQPVKGFRTSKIIGVFLGFVPWCLILPDKAEILMFGLFVQFMGICLFFSKD